MISAGIPAALRRCKIFNACSIAQMLGGQLLPQDRRTHGIAARKLSDQGVQW
jgi:hypothetical protein